MGLCLVVGAALHGVLELGNDDRSRAFALGQLVDDLKVACFGKSELLVALLPCSATMTHGSVSWLCSTVSHGLVSLRKSFGILLG